MSVTVHNSGELTYNPVLQELHSTNVRACHGRSHLANGRSREIAGWLAEVPRRWSGCSLDGFRDERMIGRTK
jgi:hypothetical protein